MENALITFKVRINKDKLDVNVSDFITQLIETIETPIVDEETHKPINFFQEKGYEIMCENFIINPKN